MNKPFRIAMLGKQGAGKGTQCSRISDQFSIPHISTGDMLRQAVKVGTEFGLKAAEFMERGDLVPDDVIIGAVVERLTQEECTGQGNTVQDLCEVSFGRSTRTDTWDETALFTNYIRLLIGVEDDLNVEEGEHDDQHAIDTDVNVGKAETRVLEDGWSVITADGSLSAHFEDTIVVTDDGPEVLTSEY